ncbi:ABC transporter permease [Rhodomicrobium vannielii ATCC 17100]|uniref:ABC transporter permease n=1 Tax=Rhodomicrobium vannielii TaxID=1069 RepID=UPI001919FAD1|nr:ABC transporter permease [Rhodomicrobium vannielii]MBJ7534808.1 ABC transporter permease [Rhodomicrobium vannielii ATCC 17100]
MLPPRLLALIVKELLAAFRDPKARIAFLIPPLMQVFLYAYAATLEVKHASIAVLNEDWGETSRQLVTRFERSSAFAPILWLKSDREIVPVIDSQRVVAVVRIGQDFSRKVAAREPATVQVILDGRKSNTAQILNGYIGSIVTQFAIDQAMGGTDPPDISTVVERSWYNPNRDYATTMVPSLVATLTMTTVLMIMVMSVARERELGTFEQLLVSPLQPHEILIGKAMPGLIVGFVLATAIMLIVTQFFHIPMLGSPLVLYAGLFVFLLAIIGVGLFISSLVSTQQQAMLGAMVYMMPAMMLSGFTSPVQNMPDWLQPVALMNPLTHFLVIVRGVFLRDMPMALVAERIWPMLFIAVFTLTAAGWLFRRKIS